jgi:CRISPR system Cascade subunit CasD
MKTYLTFSVFAPMGSMGAMVSGNNRYSQDRPARSAILGIIAAALGISRTEEEKIQELEASINIAVLVETSGNPLMDFHTAQVPAGNERYRTRSRELAAIKDTANPVISDREYRTNVFFLVALTTNNEEYSLERISDALKSSVFTLFLGRKCCPLGLPPAPTMIRASTFVDALLERRVNGLEREFLSKILDKTKSCYITLDEQEARSEGLNFTRVEYRSDKLISRQRWQFSRRSEAIISLGDEDVFEQSATS